LKVLSPPSDVPLPFIATSRYWYVVELASLVSRAETLVVEVTCCGVVTLP
jgi:hypothetical protein